jgi:hypothetical protein
VKIGLISDTHGMLRPEVLAHFEGVDLILHAGDVGDPGILVELAAVAPVHAVFGNTDGFDVRAQTSARVELTLEGWRVLLTHGDELGSPSAAALHAAYPEADIIVYGHTHVQRTEVAEGVLVINSGAAGRARFKLKPTIGILALQEGLRPGRESLRVIALT